MAAARHHPGFTLIELLVVLTIIGTLLMLALPIVGIAQRAAMRANTENLMRKVEVALGGFKADVGHYPWQERAVADLSMSGAAWGNELAYRLRHVMTAGERQALVVDRLAVQATFASGGSQDWSAAATRSLITQPDWPGSITGTYLASNQAGYAQGLNRLSLERSLVGLMSGNTGIRGVTWSGGAWSAGAKILAAPQSRGFCDDYLKGDLRSADFTTQSITVAGQPLSVPWSIIDPYREPLVYIHALVNGVTGQYPYPFFITEDWGQRAYRRIDTRWFGLSPQVRSVTSTQDSDARDSAASVYVANFELWSGGADRRFHAHRSEVVNRDNISAEPFWKELKP